MKRIKDTSKSMRKLSPSEIAKALGAEIVGKVPKGWHPWMGKPPIVSIDEKK